MGTIVESFWLLWFIISLINLQWENESNLLKLKQQRWQKHKKVSMPNITFSLYRQIALLIWLTPLMQNTDWLRAAPGSHPITETLLLHRSPAAQSIFSDVYCIKCCKFGPANNKKSAGREVEQEQALEINHLSKYIPPLSPCLFSSQTFRKWKQLSECRGRGSRLQRNWTQLTSSSLRHKRRDFKWT